MVNKTHGQVYTLDPKKKATVTYMLGKLIYMIKYIILLNMN